MQYCCLTDVKDIVCVFKSVGKRRKKRVKFKILSNTSLVINSRIYSFSLRKEK